MEQDRGGRRVVDDHQMREIQHHQQQKQKDHHERGGSKQKNQQHHPPPQQPQKCPRCDSLNTKFCYYNNYSLSQPRFFCKACRRYWTQGGTLRNVPVGGGCRKGKRLKRSSSSSPENPIINTTTSQHSNSSTLFIPSVAPSSLRNKGIIQQQATATTPSMYYPGGGGGGDGGGFLSPFTAFPSFNHQSINVGGEFGSSNLGLLQGFSHPFHTQQQLYLHHQPYHNFNLGLISSSDDGLEEKVVVQPNKQPSTSHQEWSQSFNPTSSEAKATCNYWSSCNSTTSSSTINTSTTTTTTTTTSVSLNPTHWIIDPHLSTGYGPPPPQPSTTSSSSPSFL